MCRLGGCGTGDLSPEGHDVSMATLMQGARAQMLKTRASVSHFLMCMGIIDLYLMRLIPIEQVEKLFQ